MNGNNYAITILLALVILASFIGGAFAYHAFEGTKTVTITEHIDIDSIKNVLLVGKVDSVQLSVLFKENERLRKMVQHSPSITGQPEPHPRMSVGGTWIFPDTGKVLAFSADTVLGTKLHAVAEDGEVSEHDVQIAEKVSYVPAFNLFRIEDLSVSPIAISNTVKKVTAPEIPHLLPSFQLQGLLTYRDAPGVGALVSIGDWGGGVGFEVGARPQWMIVHRF